MTLLRDKIIQPSNHKSFTSIFRDQQTVSSALANRNLSIKTEYEIGKQASVSHN